MRSDSYRKPINQVGHHINQSLITPYDSLKRVGNLKQREELIQLLQRENQDLKSENEHLKARILELQESRPSKLQCSVCLKFYRRADALRLHIHNSRDEDHSSLAKKHYGIEKCCSRNFKRRCDLDRHRNEGKCTTTQKNLPSMVKEIDKVGLNVQAPAAKNLPLSDVANAEINQIYTNPLNVSSENLNNISRPDLHPEVYIDQSHTEFDECGLWKFQPRLYSRFRDVYQSSPYHPESFEYVS